MKCKSCNEDINMYGGCACNGYTHEITDGVKFDHEKLMYELFTVEALEETTKVLTYGAKKYAPENWRKVPNLQERYYAAALRHLIEHRKGNKFDEESKLRHLAHAMCCLIFMITDEVMSEREQL